MYSELRAMEAMKIFSCLREAGSTGVRLGSGEGRVMRSVSSTKMKMRVMKRGLGRRKVRRKERGMRGRMVVKCGKSGERNPCHVRLRLKRSSLMWPFKRSGEAIEAFFEVR
jgi:hypothetical protein